MPEVSPGEGPDKSDGVKTDAPDKFINVHEFKIKSEGDPNINYSTSISTFRNQEQTLGRTSNARNHP